ncbi:MAG: lysophospholipid acyltransferase family protein [Anaeromyxobacter sp.]
MLLIFSAVYWVFVCLTMPVLYAGALLVFVITLPFDRRRLVLHMYSCMWGTFYVYANPLWRLRVKGRGLIPWRGPAVIVANHLSMLDILVLYGLYRPFKWVSKAELFKVPFVGWNMVINDYVRVWRGDRESVRRMMAHCRAHLARGTPVLLFPEGTRSLDGHLQPFKEGAFKLAHEAGVPVIPVLVTGTAQALPKHGLVIRQRMVAEVEVLPAIDTRAYATPQALREATHAVFAAALPEANKPAAPASRAAT